MNQQLSALPGVPQAAAALGTPNPGMALTAPADTPPSFANTLKDALGDLAAPDAATQALLSDVLALLPTAAPVPAATGDTLALAVGLDTAADDGNSSPESGNDLPLLLQLLDATGAPSPELAATLAAPADAALQLSQPDTAQRLPDAGGALADAVAQTALAAQLPAATAAAAASSTLPAAARAATSGVAPNALPAGQDAAVAVNYAALAVRGEVATSGQGQTASQDQHAQQHHTPRELELLTSVASVLVPVKERVSERFELAMPATPATLLSDTPSVNTSVAPATSSATLSPYTAATPMTASGRPELSIPQAPGQPGWGDVFADRVTFAMRQSLQEAEIRLNPPQLGQVDVRIVMSNDQANLMFSSPHGAVRDAIEASIGRLRDMLADSGFNLVNVDVSDKSLAQQRGDAREQRESGRGGAQAGSRADFELAANAPEVLRATGTGSIDYYV